MTPVGLPSSADVRGWCNRVVVLSLPALVFVLLHLLFASLEHRNMKLPVLADFVLSWVLGLCGIFGSLLQAFVVAVVATFASSASWKRKVVIWLSVTLSFLACVYGA
jgi:hypothetical protein